jgi:hypothetical protein
LGGRGRWHPTPWRSAGRRRVRRGAPPTPGGWPCRGSRCRGCWDQKQKHHRPGGGRCARRSGRRDPTRWPSARPGPWRQQHHPLGRATAGGMGRWASPAEPRRRRRRDRGGSGVVGGAHGVVTPLPPSRGRVEDLGEGGWRGAVGPTSWEGE